MIAKPTAEDLGIDPDAQEWQRSGEGAGVIEVAFARAPGDSRYAGTPPAPGDSPVAGTPPAARKARAAAAFPYPPSPGNEDWVLLRVMGDPDRRVLVFDRNEWECFLDGARKGEFDDAADIAP